MKTDPLIDRLAANGATLVQLLSTVPAELARWKPEPARWCILEVAAHLLDEEREDFRQRIRILFEDPSRDWPPIDPEGWVTARNYMRWDLAETVAALRDERDASIAWLRQLVSPDWSRSKEMRWGPLSAGDLLASWAAHDLLHLRQLTRLQFDHVTRVAEPNSVLYAGEW